MWKGKVPFNKQGNLMHYPHKSYLHYEENGKWIWLTDDEGQHIQIEPVWKDAYTFKDILVIQDKVNSGRSAKNLTVKSELNDKCYTLFVRDLVDIALGIGILPGGKIEGEFGFVKRGMNYGICLAGRE